MIPCLLFWATMIAALMRPSNSSGFLFYTYLAGVFTLVIIAETIGCSDFSKKTYQQTLFPLGSVGMLYWLISKGTRATRLTKSLYETLRTCDTAVKYLLGFWVMILLYLGAYLMLTAPGHAPDAKIYHLPGPIMWVARGALDVIAHIDFRINYLPRSTEILYAFYYFVTGSWIGVESVNLIIGGIIWPLSLYLLFSAISLNRSWAMLLALTGATASVNMWQMVSAYVDVHMAALLTGAMALLLQNGPSLSRTCAAGLAAGLAVSVKTMAILGLAPLGVILVLQALRAQITFKKTVCLVGLFYGVALVTGGALYIKNWLQFQNPFYPFPLDLKLFAFPGAEFALDWGTLSRLVRKGTDAVDAFFKVFLWGFGLLFGWFKHFEKKHIPDSLGFSIEILQYAAALILSLRFVQSGVSMLTRYLAGDGKRGSPIVRALLMGVVSLCWLGVFILAFWPWGDAKSPYLSVNIYYTVIYSVALVLLILIGKHLITTSFPKADLSFHQTYKTGLVVFFVGCFFYLLIKFYAPVGLLHRFAFLIVLFPLVLFSHCIRMIDATSRNLLKKVVLLICVVSIVNGLVFISPRKSAKAKLLGPAKRVYHHIKQGTQNMYWRRKSLEWRSHIQPDDTLLVITVRGPHNIRYHLPEFKRIVYMAHPQGPYRMDVDLDSIPSVIKEDLETKYRETHRRSRMLDYSIGMEYLKYLVQTAGITKIFAEVPIPLSDLPEAWSLLQQTSWGAFYQVKK